MRTIRPSITMLALSLTLMAVPAAVVTAQSSLPSATAPTAFSGRISFGPCTGRTFELVDGVMQGRGTVCRTPVLEMSDPRLDGDATIRTNEDAYPGGFTLYHSAFRIENDGGAWQQQPALVVGYPDGSYSTVTIVLVGEGDYEGLTAVAEMPLTDEIWSLNGFIIDGQTPPTTDASPPE